MQRLHVDQLSNAFIEQDRGPGLRRKRWRGKGLPVLRTAEQVLNPITALLGCELTAAVAGVHEGAELGRKA